MVVTNFNFFEFHNIFFYTLVAFVFHLQGDSYIARDHIIRKILISFTRPSMNLFFVFLIISG